jgi:hypothetical protein
MVSAAAVAASPVRAMVEVRMVCQSRQVVKSSESSRSSRMVTLQLNWKLTRNQNNFS